MKQREKVVLSCEEEVKILKSNLRAVGKSREKYRSYSEKMKQLLVEMILQTKGWMYEDLDTKASELINDFNDNKDGI